MHSDTDYKKILYFSFLLLHSFYLSFVLIDFNFRCLLSSTVIYVFSGSACWMWNQLMSLPNYSAYMSLSIALSAHLPFIHIFYTKSMSEKGPGFANFNSAVYLSENIDICLSFKTLHFLLFFLYKLSFNKLSVSI